LEWGSVGFMGGPLFMRKGEGSFVKCEQWSGLIVKDDRHRLSSLELDELGRSTHAYGEAEVGAVHHSTIELFWALVIGTTSAVIAHAPAPMDEHTVGI
jgi:hypothetical protein